MLFCLQITLSHRFALLSTASSLLSRFDPAVAVKASSQTPVAPVKGAKQHFAANLRREPPPLFLLPTAVTVAQESRDIKRIFRLRRTE